MRDTGHSGPTCNMGLSTTEVMSISSRPSRGFVDGAAEKRTAVSSRKKRRAQRETAALATPAASAWYASVNRPVLSGEARSQQCFPHGVVVVGAGLTASQPAPGPAASCWGTAQHHEVWGHALQGTCCQINKPLQQFLAGQTVGPQKKKQRRERRKEKIGMPHTRAHGRAAIRDQKRRHVKQENGKRTKMAPPHHKE
ncbi:Glyceraldehyde-3-phosphate dehydrogenase (phosphorylating) [Trypanosoma cruzi]|nr:Glyceraldehyde-3-phosphate dehydrogenase (phosphorylating) [Trypanosoma cruzi]